MNKIIVRTDSEDFITQKKPEKRGAKVYGLPLTKELASYLDDVAPDAQQTRIINMFFAGKFRPIELEDDDPDGDEE